MATAERTTSLDAGLAGRRVLVTAGAAGIGLAIVERLLAHGARIFVCDVDDAVLASFAKANPQAEAIKADVSSEADVDRMFAAVRAELGGLDALINNAGIAGPTGAVEDIDPAEWRRCIDIDLTGQFLCTRRAVPMLKISRRRLDHQHFVGGRPPRLCLPHTVLFGKVRHHWLHAKPG